MADGAEGYHWTLVPRPRGPESPGDLVAADYLRTRLDEQFRTIQGADDRARIAVGFAFAALTVFAAAMLFVLESGTVIVQVAAMPGVIVVVATAGKVLYHFGQVYQQQEWDYGPTATSVLDAASGVRETDEGQRIPASAEEVAQWLAAWLAYAWDQNHGALAKKLMNVRATTKWLLYHAVAVGLSIAVVVGVSIGENGSRQWFGGDATESPSAASPRAGEDAGSPVEE